MVSYLITKMFSEWNGNDRFCGLLLASELEWNEIKHKAPKHINLAKQTAALVMYIGLLSPTIVGVLHENIEIVKRSRF